MLRKFIGDSLLYGVSAIASKLLLLLVLPLLTYYYKPEDLGIIDTISILAALLPPLVSLEIYQGFARLYPEIQSKCEKSRIISSSLTFTLFSNVLLLILFIFQSSYLMNYLGFIKYTFESSLLVSVLIITSFLFSSLIEHLRWMQLTKIYALGNILYVTLFTLFLFIGLKGFPISISVYLYSSQIAYTIVIIYLLYKIKDHLTFDFDLFYFKKLLGYSLPLVVSTFAFNASQYIDRITVKEFYGNDSLGIIGLAIRISALVSVVVVIFQGPLMPLIYREYSSENSKYWIQFILKLFLFSFSIVICFVSVFSYEIISSLSSQSYLYASVVLPFFCLKTFFSQAYSFAPGLSIAKKTKIVSLIFLGYLLLNVISLPLYAKSSSLVFLALGSALNSIIFFFIYYHISSKFFKLGISYKLLFSIVSYLLVSIFVINYVNEFLREISSSSLLFSGLICIVQIFICFFICFSRKDQLFIISKFKK